ncbi:hypothetical protein TSAR_003741 [Trichomalopsis sarcophagae]|uniref:Cytochrome c oxidase assembly factor 7 homolog n=1 Tax=Trichomalopsis sarcophagae TaxID=543379 RepID=A0A232FB06_9HYME|nr:hypothetical protein TSAR_003741 [Trichomalopsis sarcophagae]
MAYDLKSEEDVKLYLKNLYTEYQFGCYGEKNPEVCHLLGDYHEALKKDFKGAADIYQKNCDNFNFGRSCAKFGGYKLIGKGCKKDMNDAFTYMKKGCEFNDEIGCTNAGILAVSSPEIQSNDRAKVINDGLKMLDKSCREYKTDKACFFLAGIYMSGIEGVVQKNLAEAYKLSLIACEHNNPYACANVSQMHARGEGAQKNEELAQTFKKRALELERELKSTQSGIKFGQGIEP